MPPMIVWATSALLCPFFTEFFPDPTEVSDAAGEFIEIALDSTKTDITKIISKIGKGDY